VQLGRGDFGRESRADDHHDVITQASKRLCSAGKFNHQERVSIVYQFSTRSVTQLGLCLMLIVCLTFSSGMLVGLGMGRMEPAPESGPADEGALSSPFTGREQREGSQAQHLPVQQGHDVETDRSLESGPTMLARERPHSQAVTGQQIPALKSKASASSLHEQQSEPVRVSHAPHAPAPFRGDGVSPPRKRVHAPAPGFGLQVGAFRIPTDAEQWLEDMRERGFEGRILEHTDQKGRRWHRVVIGHYPTYAQAGAEAEAFEVEENIPVLIRTLDRVVARRSSMDREARAVSSGNFH
jgi:cell division protein FtsN